MVAAMTGNKPIERCQYYVTRNRPVHYFMFGDIAVAFIISMIVSVSLAFKIAG